MCGGFTPPLLSSPPSPPPPSQARLPGQLAQLASATAKYVELVLRVGDDPAVDKDAHRRREAMDAEVKAVNLTLSHIRAVPWRGAAEYADAGAAAVRALRDVRDTAISLHFVRDERGREGAAMPFYVAGAAAALMAVLGTAADSVANRRPPPPGLTDEFRSQVRAPLWGTQRHFFPMGPGKPQIFHARFVLARGGWPDSTPERGRN